MKPKRPSDYPWPVTAHHASFIEDFNNAMDSRPITPTTASDSAVSTPTATPRTDAALLTSDCAYNCGHTFKLLIEEKYDQGKCVSTGPDIAWGNAGVVVLADLARELETELACEKENRNHLIEKGAKLEAELTAAQAECVKWQRLLTMSRDDRETDLETELARLRTEVERLKALGSWAHTCIHHTDDQRTRAERCPVCATAEIARLRAENLTAHQMACAAGLERDQLRAENQKLWRERDELETFKTITDLRAENSTLRAAQKACEACDEPTAFEVRQLRTEVERLKGALALGQENCDAIYNDMRDERTELTARAEKAEAERDALAKDKARLDWLKSNVEEIYSNDRGGIVYLSGDNIRDGIDAVMKP